MTYSGWQHMLYVHFNTINGTIIDVQISHALGAYIPLYHPRCWLLIFVLVTTRIAFFLFSPKDAPSVILKKPSEIWTQTKRTLFQFDCVVLPSPCINILHRKRVDFLCSTAWRIEGHQLLMMSSLPWTPPDSPLSLQLCVRKHWARVTYNSHYSIMLPSTLKHTEKLKNIFRHALVTGS